MERLTDKRMKGEGFIPVDPKEYKAILREEKPTGKQIYHRLLEIEDILGENYDLERLRELVQRDREGLCAILPCKVEDTVYVITFSNGIRLAEKEILKCTVTQMRIKSDGITIGFSCRGNYSNGNHYIGNFSFKSIGKTVFITREAAEDALKESEK